jgi:hypothetical protein
MSYFMIFGIAVVPSFWYFIKEPPGSGAPGSRMGGNQFHIIPGYGNIKEEKEDHGETVDV